MGSTSTISFVCAGTLKMPVGVGIAAGTAFQLPQQTSLVALVADQSHQAPAVELTVEIDPFDAAEVTPPNAMVTIPGHENYSSDHVGFATGAPDFQAAGRRDEFEQMRLARIGHKDR